MYLFTPIIQHSSLTAIQKAIYVFIFPQGRVVQIKSQGIHGILKDRKENLFVINTFYETCLLKQLVKKLTLTSFNVHRDSLLTNTPCCLIEVNKTE